MGQRTLFRCTVCHKLTGGRLPKGGDGTFYFPRRHADNDGNLCPGSLKEAEMIGEEEARAEVRRFGQLAVGEVFEFESFYKHKGLAAGPWKKISTRKYCRISDEKFVCNVGMISVLCRLLPQAAAPVQETQREAVQQQEAWFAYMREHGMNEKDWQVAVSSALHAGDAMLYFELTIFSSYAMEKRLETWAYVWPHMDRESVLRCAQVIARKRKIPTYEGE